MIIEDVILRAAARLMGSRGGGANSDKQKKAQRKNGKKGGRKRTYSYQMKAEGVMGKKSEKICVIPDEVIQNPEKYWTKTFAVLSEGKRYNARVWACSEDKTNIRVRRV